LGLAFYLPRVRSSEALGVVRRDRYRGFGYAGKSSRSERIRERIQESGGFADGKAWQELHLNLRLLCHARLLERAYHIVAGEGLVQYLTLSATENTIISPLFATYYRDFLFSRIQYYCSRTVVAIGLTPGLFVDLIAQVLDDERTHDFHHFGPNPAFCYLNKPPGRPGESSTSALLQ
jgi:hypothetical protein